eukprot:COSAG06_NODE_34261_length_477_cov_0.904762_1_plen_71_part_10
MRDCFDRVETVAKLSPGLLSHHGDISESHHDDRHILAVDSVTISGREHLRLQDRTRNVMSVDRFIGGGGGG